MKKTSRAFKLRRQGRRRLLLTGAIILGIALVAIGAGIIWGTLTGTLFSDAVEREVIQAPAAVQAVSVHNSPIVALRKDSAIDSPLLLFLPATGAATTRYTTFENAAVDDGFHVLALPYANRRTERSICMSDPLCYDQVRAEQFFGTPSRALPPRAAQASVQSTLVAALNAMQHKDPNGGWNNYVRAGSVRWPRIVLAGHSQGGGLAAYIAHQTAAKGVIMFSSPNDVYLKSKTVAHWLGQPSATPLEKYYGLLDTHDSYASSTTAAWRTMFGSITVAKSDGAKELTGRFFSTTATHFPEHLTPHFAVATDEAYEPVWDYMLEKTSE